ncbi:MAG: hypothetical protein A2808_03675 [Candidatus Moranbacteria bacterium RIFCSPHIGHO2_01_FULL_55_24]|nr:MAG: hypothetical protein A2808_03675 [Candidatus Moranbacteria bacterium RIFCSPHIGHO2_01_FULL_55_24]
MNMKKIHFPGQRETETVVSIVHRHWFNLLSHLFIVFVMAFFLLGSLFLIPLLFPEITAGERFRFLIFLQNTLFVFLWLYGFLVWIDYYFDIWIITDERILNIEQKGLFVRHISELTYGRVQDITTTVEGIVPTMFNFGDLYVQTAGENGRFIFRQVPDPLHLKDTIMRITRDAASGSPKASL